MMIDFQIKTLDSQNHDFSVNSDTTVAELKDIITESLHIQPADQRLIFCGRVLQNENTLASYNVHNKVIHLVQRPPPSQLRPPPSRANPQTDRTRTVPIGQDGRGGAGLVFETYNISTDMESPELSRGTILWITIERLEHVRRLLQDIRETLDELELIARTSKRYNHRDITTSSEPNSDTSEDREETEANATAAGPSNDFSGAEYFTTTTNTNTEGNEANLVTDGLPRAALLADILEEVHGLQGRLQPFYRQYIAHLRDHHTKAQAERFNERQFNSNQTVAQKIRLLMHAFSHAYHTISEIQYEFDENRLTSLPPPPQAGIPIQAQINVLASRRPGAAQQDGVGAQPEGEARPDSTRVQSGEAGPQSDRAESQPNGAGPIPPAAMEVTIDELMGHFHQNPGGARPSGMPYHVQIETHMPIAIAVAERLTLPTHNHTQASRQAGTQPNAPSSGTGHNVDSAPLGGNPLGTILMGTAPLGANPLGTVLMGTGPLGANLLGTVPTSTTAQGTTAQGSTAQGTSPTTPASNESPTRRPSNTGAVPRPRISVMPVTFGDIGNEPMEMLMPDFANLRRLDGPPEFPGGVTHELIQNIIQTVLNRTPGAIRHETHTHTHTGQRHHGHFRMATRSRRTRPSNVQSGSTAGPNNRPQFPQSLAQDLIDANQFVRREGHPHRPQHNQFRSYDRFLACASPFRDRYYSARYPDDGRHRTDEEHLDVFNVLVNTLDRYRLINFFDPADPDHSLLTNELLSFLARQLTLGDLIRLILGNWRPLEHLHGPLNEMLRRHIITNENMSENELAQSLEEAASQIVNVQNSHWIEISSSTYFRRADEPSDNNMTTALQSTMSHNIAEMMNLVINNTQPDIFASCLYQLMLRLIEEVCTILYMSCTGSHTGAELVIRDYMRLMLRDFDPAYQRFLFTLMQPKMLRLRMRVVNRNPNGEQPDANNPNTVGHSELGSNINEPHLPEHQHEEDYALLLSRMMEIDEPEDILHLEPDVVTLEYPDTHEIIDTPESPDEENRVPQPGRPLLNHCYTNHRRIDFHNLDNNSPYARPEDRQSEAAGSQESVTMEDPRNVSKENISILNAEEPSSTGNVPANAIAAINDPRVATNIPSAAATDNVESSTQLEPSQSCNALPNEVLDFDGNEDGGTPANPVEEVDIATNRPADWSKTVPVEWIPVLTEDERRQWRQAVQPPFSDAYLSGMPARKRKIIQQRKPQNFQQLLQDNLREANGQQSAGNQSTGSSGSPSLGSDGDEQLLRSYCEAARREAQARITSDPDFSPQRYPASQRYYNTSEPTESSQNPEIKKV